MTSIIVSGLKASGKTKIVDELMKEDRYKNRVVIVDADSFSYYEKEVYECPQSVIKALVQLPNVIVAGNMHAAMFDYHFVIDLTYEEWRASMVHRLRSGRVNSAYSSQKDSDLAKMSKLEYAAYKKERFSKWTSANSVFLSYKQIYDKLNSFLKTGVIPQK